MTTLPADELVELASKAVVLEWQKMVQEMQPHMSIGEAARSFVSPGNYRLVRAALTPAMSRIEAQTAELSSLRAKLAEAMEVVARPCTCHPDDNPPVPCAKKYALSECQAAARRLVEGNGNG